MPHYRLTSAGNRGAALLSAGNLLATSVNHGARALRYLLTSTDYQA
jgi:hypothetical protein